MNKRFRLRINIILDKMNNLLNVKFLRETRDLLLPKLISCEIEV